MFISSIFSIPSVSVLRTDIIAIQLTLLLYKWKTYENKVLSLYACAGNESSNQKTVIVVIPVAVASILIFIIGGCLLWKKSKKGKFGNI